MSEKSSQISKIILLLIITFAIASASIMYVSSNYQQLFEKNYTILIADKKDTQKVVLNYGPQIALSNPDFFSQTKQSFIDQKATFIFADLANMKVSLYENGAVTKEFPILTKGKEGSWWETPAGLYKVETKEKNHFSSFGKVNQPWSMSFQGNFFIHGWPTHPDGSPVSSTYSGGCIRLADDSAKEIYKSVSVGTPILVFEKDFISDNKQFEISKPTLTSEKYLIADLKSNFVFLDNGSKLPVPITSLTNLVTALVATEYVKLDIELPALTQKEKLDQTDRIKAGHTYTGYQLLFPLLIESSKDAAQMLARYVGKERFVDLMNKKGLSIGMTQTTFVNEHGEGGSNTSSLSDLFSLAKYIYNNRSFILKLSSGSGVNNAYEQPQFKNLQTPVIFKEDDGYLGGIQDVDRNNKSGLYIFEKQIGGETRPIVIIISNSKNINEDIRASLNYLNSFK
jgi:lipoprotein-anchoring transpeptidase ErfK/SrfK